MAQLREGSVIKKSTGDEVIATVNDIPEIPTSLPADGGNADTVGGFTVGTNVPANAKFTDTNTTYSEITTAEIDLGTASTLRAVTARRVQYILDKVSTMISTAIGSLTKSSVGLSNVDNTSDLSKPISTATQTALNGKQNALGYTPVNKAGDSMTGSLAVEHTTFPVVDITRNSSSTGGNVYGGARMVRKTTNPANGVGIGFYFQAPNSNKTITHAGMFGGALGTIQAGSEKGEIVISPSYAGQDPYARRDLIVRAISTSKAEAELNGKLKTDQTLASDSANTVATKKYVDDKQIYHVGATAPSDTNIFWIDTSL